MRYLWCRFKKWPGGRTRRKEIKEKGKKGRREGGQMNRWMMRMYNEKGKKPGRNAFFSPCFSLSSQAQSRFKVWGKYKGKWTLIQNIITCRTPNLLKIHRGFKTMTTCVAQSSSEVLIYSQADHYDQTVATRQRPKCWHFCSENKAIGCLRVKKTLPGRCR